MGTSRPFDLETLLAVTHAASQIWGRWLTLPEGISDGGGSTDAGTLESLYLRTEAEWRAVITGLLPMPWVAKYLERRDPGGHLAAAALVRHIRGVLAVGGAYLLASDVRFPALLLKIQDPPAAVTLLGDATLLHRGAVAVVGSRKASAFAVQQSFALGRGLAMHGLVVVSGGAFGCDVAAHHGVLDTGLTPVPAVCVFAGGLSRLYPASNGPVFRRLAEGRAALVSERLWDAPSRPKDFPARNRLIAGLAGVVAIMQAGERSGAIVTARLALDQGRDVAVLHHPEDDVRAAGSARLLRDGAPGFSSAESLLEKLQAQPRN